MNHSVNEFSRMLAGLLAISCAGVGSAETPASAASVGQVPPGYSLAGTGSREDFNYFAGAWTTRQRQLKERGIGSTQWKDGPSNIHCATQYLDGVVTAEESYSPTKAPSGLFLYSFDLEKHQWTLYWIDPKSGKLESPLVGGFAGARGEFYGEDVDNGQPVKVRYSWIKKDRDHARWEQAFSFDNRTWETNWTSEFTRADPAKYCARMGYRPPAQQ